MCRLKNIVLWPSLCSHGIQHNKSLFVAADNSLLCSVCVCVCLCVVFLVSQSHCCHLTCQSHSLVSVFHIFFFSSCTCVQQLHSIGFLLLLLLLLNNIIKLILIRIIQCMHNMNICPVCKMFINQNYNCIYENFTFFPRFLDVNKYYGVRMISQFQCTCKNVAECFKMSIKDNRINGICARLGFREKITCDKFSFYTHQAVIHSFEIQRKIKKIANVYSCNVHANHFRDTTIAIALFYRIFMHITTCRRNVQLFSGCPQEPF